MRKIHDFIELIRIVDSQTSRWMAQIRINKYKCEFIMKLDWSLSGSSTSYNFSKIAQDTAKRNDFYTENTGTFTFFAPQQTTKITTWIAMNSKKRKCILLVHMLSTIANSKLILLYFFITVCFLWVFFQLHVRFRSKFHWCMLFIAVCFIHNNDDVVS